MHSSPAFSRSEPPQDEEGKESVMRFISPVLPPPRMTYKSANLASHTRLEAAPGRKGNRLVSRYTAAVTRMIWDCFYRSRCVRRTYVVSKGSEDDVIGRLSPLLLPDFDSVESTKRARSMVYDGGALFKLKMQLPIFSFLSLYILSSLHSSPSPPLTLSPVACFCSLRSQEALVGSVQQEEIRVDRSDDEVVALVSSFFRHRSLFSFLVTDVDVPALPL